MATQPQFKPGDRFFTHYDMQWGTVIEESVTYRDQTHGVTGSKLPDTTWYEVKYDNGKTSNLDDGHGNWDMARMVPPHIAKRFGYGDDPNPVRERENVIATNQIAANAASDIEPVNAQMRVKRVR
jgi:hypothetical protein